MLSFSWENKIQKLYVYCGPRSPQLGLTHFSIFFHFTIHAELDDHTSTYDDTITP